MEGGLSVNKVSFLFHVLFRTLNRWITRFRNGEMERMPDFGETSKNFSAIWSTPGSLIGTESLRVFFQSSLRKRVFSRTTQGLLTRMLLTPRHRQVRFYVVDTSRNNEDYSLFAIHRRDACPLESVGSEFEECESMSLVCVGSRQLPSVVLRGVSGESFRRNLYNHLLPLSELSLDQKRVFKTTMLQLVAIPRSVPHLKNWPARSADLTPMQWGRTGMKSEANEIVLCPCQLFSKIK